MSSSVSQNETYAEMASLGLLIGYLFCTDEKIRYAKKGLLLRDDQAAITNLPKTLRAYLGL